MGYIGQKMSVRAKKAYDSGEMPYSKWTKAVILGELTSVGLNANQFRKYSADTLRNYFLYYSAWHHTGKCFNETGFYGLSVPDPIDFDKLNKLEAENKEKRAKARAEKKEVEEEIALITYGEWTGPRKHMKLEEHTEYAIIIGNVAHLAYGKTKRLSGSHIEVVETYKRCPPGHKADIDLIREYLKK